jgi:predicted DsbA family dithiol-disulfide isomerase
MRFSIEIYSDTSCPWCYLGKKALIQAVEAYRKEYSDAQFDLLWRPYYLNPGAGSSGKLRALLCPPVRQSSH